MRIASVVHLTSVHSAEDGRIFHKECRSLAHAGFHVTCVGSHTHDAIVDQVRIKSIVRDQGRLARMTRTAWRVYRAAIELNADVYHFHDPELIPVGLLLRALGKHVIYDVHEDLPKDILAKPYLPAWSRRPIAWAMDKVERAAGGRFSALVAVTPSIANRFRQVNTRTIVVHNYPLVKELILDSQPRPWEARRQSVAYIGGMMAMRGIREMIEAVSLLPRSLPATLELAGPHPRGEATAEELSAYPGWERVRHHGFVKLAETFEILRSVRAGLVLFHPVPNHIEAMPQKIFEYMGAGIPVIASDFPLWRRILGEPCCGIFVNPQNPRDIARAIEHILLNPAEAEEMGRRGRAAVLEHYNWDVQAERLVNLYEELMKPLCEA
jgi:glycosyltransferase involved in cell wall biosynthesis